MAQAVEESHAVKAGTLNPELKAVDDTEIYLERVNTSYAYESFKKFMVKEGIN
ncbi:hypothetical protein SDC9_184311 [bioreactor metagenome]|uniref:Uncharacterized protein n=1 Tax=bioreactor metagenome TaxID=1076179 RepID=A0A645HDK1_9ZZZZ